MLFVHLSFAYVDEIENEYKVIKHVHLLINYN
jgi:hypothetical protein